MVSRHRTLPSLEKQSRRQEAERHAVPTVAQGEPVTGIAAMWADVRKRVWRRREESLPRELRVDGRHGWKSRFEVCAQLFDRCRELLPTPHARPDEAVAASQQESMLGSPSRIVVRTLGVPHHHVREAKFTTFSSD